MIKVCLKFIVAINEGQNSLEFLRRGEGIIATEASFSRGESEVAVVKDSSREQIVASILILLFRRQYLAFSDSFMTFFTLDAAAKF